MRIAPRRSSESDTLNITPLIDVVFLLIIFFLVATSFEVIQRELKVDLPKSSTAATVSREIQPVAVTVSQDGTITMSGEVIPLKELPGRLKSAVASARRHRVFVRGDAKTFHENVVGVLGACQEAGITDVSLVTE